MNRRPSIRLIAKKKNESVLRPRLEIMDLEVAVGSRFQFPRVCIYSSIHPYLKNQVNLMDSDFADHEIKQ